MRRILLIVAFLALFSLFSYPLPTLSQQQDSGEALTDPDAITSFADALSRRGSLFGAAMEHERLRYLQPSSPAAGQERAGSLLGFADHLFEEGHYYQAVTEYQRFIYFNPGHASVPRARLQTARCYKMGEQYEKAIGLYRELAVLYADREEGTEAAFEAGDCLRLSEDYDQALLEFSRFIQGHPSHPLADTARWNMVWMYIRLQDYASAQSGLVLLNGSSRYQTSSRELLDALGKFPFLPRKSPFLSGVLAAIVPGAGHLYTGQKKQALFSFVTNALLIFGSYEAFSKELYTAGGFISLLSINYYSGNIFGAVTSAHKFNRQTREELLEEIMQKYTGQ